MTGQTQNISDNVSVVDQITSEAIAGGNVSIGVSDNLVFTDSVTFQTTSPISSQPQTVRTVIETYASDGSVSSRKQINQLLSAEINKDGDRTVDTATFVYPMNVSVAQNNGVLYIQDIVDTRFLRGIWNFHYNILDESGNALDGTSSNEAVGKYNALATPLLGRNNYGFDGSGNATWIARRIVSSGDQITVTNASNVIDLSAQFDIMFHFSCLTNADSNSNPKYIFDTQHGGGTGLSIYLSATGIATVDKNGGVNLITGTTTNLNDENWHFIRLVRDSSNNIRMFVDGVQEGSTVVSSESYQNSGADVTFGTTSASVANRIMNGCLLQMRIYCGGVLNDTDALTVFGYNPQPYTMKFGGIVWKIDDGTDSKTVYCKSFAKQLGDIQLSYTNLVTSSGTLASGKYIANNVYAGQRSDEIIKDFVTNVLSGWTVMVVPTFSTVISKYVASGAFLTNLFYLLYTESGAGNDGKLTFFSTARKVMIIENINKDHTGNPGSLTFVGVQAGGRYDITDDGQDDTAYINDIESSGAVYEVGDTVTATASTTSADSKNVVAVNHPPISAKVQQPNGTYLVMDSKTAGGPAAGKFAIDAENNRILFGTSFTGSTCTIDYIYEDNNSAVWRNSDSTGITQNGRYSKQYNFIQLRDFLAMRLLVANILSRFGNTGTHKLPRRITIDAPTLINSIRENYYVTITNGVKGAVDSTNFSSAKYAIKQIVYKYPESTTTIHLGDFLYDMFDPINASATTVDQNTQSYTVTKNLATPP